MKYTFKQILSLDERKQEFQKVLSEANGKIPVICEKDPYSNIEQLNKIKYLVSPEMKVNQFKSLLRRKLKLNKENAIFFMANGKNIIVGTELFSEIYNKFIDEDGFLYITYACEDIWG